MTKKLGERLVEAGLVTSDAVEQALQHQKITGHKLGECLVEIGALPETSLLRFLASEHKTRFVSTDKLAKAKVSADLLDKIPVRMAEAQHFLPLAVDEQRKILSIVAATPQDESLMQEIALVAGVDEVYAYVGLSTSIAAAIRKHYYGDSTAFDTLDMADYGPAARPDLSNAGAESRASARGTPLPLRFETDARSRLSSRPGTQSGVQSTTSREVGIVRGAVADNDFTQTLNVLVGLLETSRGDLRGHSSQLARQAAMVAQRLSMPPREVTHVAVTAYLHDLGKVAKHFTLASNSANGAWKIEANAVLRVPLKLFEAVRLAPAVTTALAQLYEAFDGSGVPLGLTGDQISIGARILGAMDSYLDLTKNSGNALGRLFSKEEALTFLEEQSGKLFDPQIVEVIHRIHSGDLLRKRIETEGRQVLIADPEDPESALVDGLKKLGIVTHTLNTLEGAVDAALGSEVDLLVVSLRFGSPLLMGVIDMLRADPVRASLPVVLLGEPTDALSRGQLERAGVTLTLPMPLDVDHAAHAIAALYRQRIDQGAPARTVRGSFDEMPHAELLRTLEAHKKSGRLTLRSQDREGYLQLESGRVVFAAYDGVTAEPAVQALLGLHHADFSYDADALLLELPHLSVDLSAIIDQLQDGTPAA